MHTRILSVGSYIPKHVVTNDDLAKTIDTSDEWIKKRTGIVKRHITAAEETNGDMAYAASLQALKRAHLEPKDIDLIIVATCTPDRSMPSMACMLQAALNVPVCTAFDVSAVCSGFIYGLSVADLFIRDGRSTTALVVGSEQLSSLLDWNDRSTCVLFGDGAGAFILGASEKAGVLDFCLSADGNKAPLLYAYHPTAFPNETSYIHMQGRELFKVVVPIISNAVRQLLDKNNLSLADIDWLIPHQANDRINEAVAKNLGIAAEKVIFCIDEFANTSAASIPLAMDYAIKQGKIKRGDRIMSVGFGSGLTWGAILFDYI